MLGQSYPNGPPPEMPGMMALNPQMGGAEIPMPQQGIEDFAHAQPPMPPPAERLPPDQLFRMYQAWEQAKRHEIHEQFIAARYYHGKQWTDKEIKALKRRNQPITWKNRIRRKIDGLVGIEQRLRRDPKAYARNPGVDHAAPVATATLRFVEDANTWPALASECSRDALMRGAGIQWAGVVRGKKRIEIKKHQVPSDRFFYDPRSERWDFEDSRYLGEAQWTDMEQAKEMLPWAADMIEQLGEIGAGTQSTLPQLFAKEKNWSLMVDMRMRRIFLISIWYKHKGEWLFDFLVGSISLCPSEPQSDMQTGETVPPMDCRSPYIDENEQTVHPYVAWSPYVDEEGTRYGPIRDMIPIQDEINKRSSKSLHLLTVRQTKGDKGAVDDIDAMKAELARGDGHVVTNPGKNFEVLEQSAQIQGNLELLQEAKGEIESVGPNQALQGRGGENQSGRAILAQQNSGMADLSPVFERLREWKLRCYRKDWNLIRQFYTDERIIRITGNPNAIEYLKINTPMLDPNTGQPAIDPQTGQPRMQNEIAAIDVDIILDEGPDTVTMREELMDQLSQLGPGVVPPELLIEMSNISEKDVLLQKLAEFKAPPPDVQALQKRMAQLEELTKAAQLDKVVADTESAQATALKTLADAGIPPQMAPQAGQAFPFFHREPNFTDQAEQQVGGGQPQGPPPGMAQNGLGGPPSAQRPSDGGMPPPNALGAQGPSGGPPGQPPGAEVPQDYLAASSTPWLPGDEPQLNQPGGLPLPNG